MCVDEVCCIFATRDDTGLTCYRSDGEAVAVNLPDVEPVEIPEGVKWIDPTHANLPDHEHSHSHSHGHSHS